MQSLLAYGFMAILFHYEWQIKDSHDDEVINLLHRIMKRSLKGFVLLRGLY